MATRGKGVVTPLSSMFPAEEARKAAQRVQESITEQHQELDKLQGFVDDNTNLINLVQRLPDELSHQIMVPFGKGAFFPGRLVHTNEFLVLLGEGYFAERTAKQTVEILKRRGNTLESHVDSLKAVIGDLKTEAAFFDRTAAEAAEGLVDIREEYTEDEEDSGESQEKSEASNAPEVVNETGIIDDGEYARMMSRFDELEKEELDEESAEEENDDVHNKAFNNLNQDQRHSDGQSYGEEFYRVSLPATFGESKLIHGPSSLRPADKVLPERSTVKDYPSVSKPSVQPVSKPSVQPVSKPSVQPVSKPISEDSVPMPKAEAGSRIPIAATKSLRVFTGSIIERADNLPPPPDKVTANQPTNPQPSKPVSRFKMQRRAA